MKGDPRFAPFGLYAARSCTLEKFEFKILVTAMTVNRRQQSSFVGVHLEVLKLPIQLALEAS